MVNTNNSSIPHVLELNRVKRAYTGGKLLNLWQGIDNSVDGNYSEEFLSSTVEVTNADKSFQEGLSKTILPNGQSKTLKELIEEDYEAMLGTNFKEKKDVCVSCRVGDTTVRLVLQCHPDAEFAKKYLNFPNGKSEAWYIIETRKIDGQKPILYVGFKKGVTREIWRELLIKQDIKGMLDCMHVLDVEKGGVYFVPAGMPHCLGAGIVFCEIHEPCDYTFRVEKDYLPNRKFSDFELHYGLGNELLMDAFHYDTYTEEEIKKICVLNCKTNFVSESVVTSEIVSFEQAERFRVEKYVFSESFYLPDEDSHRIAITIKNHSNFETHGYDVVAPQGRAIFLPAAAKNVKISPSDDGENILLVCYPSNERDVAKKIFKNPIQIGVLTKNLTQYLEKLENTFGMGTFRIADYPPKNMSPFMEYRGKKGQFKAKFCFCNLGNIELELIQPLEGDNIWSEFIEQHGNSIHHIKFLVENHKEAEKYLNENGYHITQRGEGVGSNAGKVWAFYDTFDDIGFDVELMNDLKV